MKIVFGNNDRLENRGLSVADTDTKIPIGEQFSRESEVTVKGPVKYIASAIGFIIFAAVAYVVVRLIV